MFTPQKNAGRFWWFDEYLFKRVETSTIYYWHFVYFLQMYFLKQKTKDFQIWYRANYYIIYITFIALSQDGCLICLPSSGLSGVILSTERSVGACVVNLYKHGVLLVFDDGWFGFIFLWWTNLTFSTEIWVVCWDDVELFTWSPSPEKKKKTWKNSATGCFGESCQNDFLQCSQWKDLSETRCWIKANTLKKCHPFRGMSLI